MHAHRRATTAFVACLVSCLSLSACAEPARSPEQANSAAQKESIQDVFRTHRAELKACYDSVLAEQPGVEGTVELRFAIETDGSVQDATIPPNAVGSAELDACLLSVVNGWWFAEQTERTVVTYPLRFSAQELAEGLPREAIAEVIRARRSDYKACYEAALEADPELGGELVLSFGIAADGSVVEPGVTDSTLENGALEACVVGHVAKLRFPEPKGSAPLRVRYPLSFWPI